MKSEQIEKVSFNDLISAFCTKNVDTVDTFLSENSHLLIEKNEFNETALHLAIRNGNNDIVDLVINKTHVALETEFQDSIKSITNDGSNVLHYIAKFGTEANLVSVMLHLQDHMYVASQQVTNIGDLPLQLIESNPNTDQKDKLRKLFKIYTISNQASDVNQLLKFDELYLNLTKEENENKDLVTSLIAAVEAINIVRSVILYSLTHPSINKESAQVLADREEKITKLRVETDQAELKVTDTDDFSYLQRLKFISEIIQKWQLANCQEYACLVLNALYDLKIDASACRYRVGNGNEESGHEFVVMGLKSGNDPHDFKTWDKGAIIVDAWSGDVYPATRIPEKLKSHIWQRIDGRNYSITPHFNPIFHCLFPVPNSFTLKDKNEEKENKKKGENKVKGQYAFFSYSDTDDEAMTEMEGFELGDLQDEKDNGAKLAQFGKLFQNTQLQQPQENESLLQLNSAKKY